MIALQDRFLAICVRPSSERHSTTALRCFTIAPLSRGPFITFEGSEGCGAILRVANNCLPAIASLKIQMAEGPASLCHLQNFPN